MSKGRLEAFSEGVIAIIITIMVLEMKTPSGHDLDAPQPLIPIALSYLLSFVYLGNYWKTLGPSRSRQDRRRGGTPPPAPGTTKSIDSLRGSDAWMDT